MNVQHCQSARSFCHELKVGNTGAIARTVTIALGIVLLLGAVVAHAFSGGTAQMII